MRTILELTLGPLNDALGALPLAAARVAAGLLLAVPTVAVWRFGREWVFRGAPDRSRWRDLRIWAALFVLPYLVIYLFLA